MRRTSHRMTAALFNDTSGKGHQGCDLVVEQIRLGLEKHGITIAWSHPVGADWRKAEGQVLAKPRVDVAVVNGEGSIHRSASRLRAVFLPALGPFIRDRMGVPAFLVNSTIFEISAEAAADISAFSGVFVRDSGSLAELRRHGVAGGTVIADLSICAQLRPSDGRDGIGVTDSVLPEVTERLWECADSHGWTFQPMHSHSFSQRWARKLRLQRLLPKIMLQPPDIAKFAASHQAIVTGRFHAITLCIATRTPFVAVASNTPKIEWLLDDVFGNHRRLVAPNKLHDLDISMFNYWSPAEQNSLNSTIERTKNAAANMFRRISIAAMETRYDPAPGKVPIY